MKAEAYFSQSYDEARARFLEACGQCDLSVVHHRHPTASGPGGEPLHMDVAWLGPADADRVLFLCSGTHGVEGYCGSGIQTALLADGQFSKLPDGLAIGFVHAVNPYGFAHDRRVNEDNIDLNRNFLEFDERPPANPGYADLHPWLFPQEWEGETRAAADAALKAYAAEKGVAAYVEAASGGQYSHPDGLFYGGARPSWSVETFLSIAQEMTTTARRVSVIDFHTGLGPYGHGELIALGSDAQKQRSAVLYPDFEVTDPDAGTSVSAPLKGTMGHGLERVLSPIDTTYISLEYGTVYSKAVMTALRADNWLHHRGASSGELRAQIKRQIRDAFYCDEARWKALVVDRAAAVVDAAIAGLR